MTQTLRGIATVNFYAANHKEAVKWYADFLEIQPYFIGIMTNPHYLEILNAKMASK